MGRCSRSKCFPLSRDPKIVARFTEEARTAATLRGHPNIGEIFDIGEGYGLHYLIMPYVEGEDLSSYLERNGWLSNEVALNVACQVTEALVWAGERNIVHRDLKPSNVRIDRSGPLSCWILELPKQAIFQPH